MAGLVPNHTPRVNAGLGGFHSYSPALSIRICKQLCVPLCLCTIFFGKHLKVNAFKHLYEGFEELRSCMNR